MEQPMSPHPTRQETPDVSAGHEDRSGAKRGRPRPLVVVALVLAAAGLIWQSARPVDTTPPTASYREELPDQPLFAEDETQVTFVLRDEQGKIPTFFLFTEKEQATTALAINTFRRTPEPRGVELRFEAIRFLQDEDEPDKLWVRAVGIANETDGKTPISRDRLESGEPLDLLFHDEIQVRFVAHVVYEIRMTIQYLPQTQRLQLTNTSGSISWKMLGSEDYDQTHLESTIVGRKAEYAEKPLVRF